MSTSADPHSDQMSKEHNKPMRPNVIVALVVGLVLGFAGGRAVNGSSADAPTGNKPAAAANAPRPNARPVDPTVFKVPVDGSPTKGNADALVTLVEFSDYQCPFCSRANATVQQLQKDYGNKLRVVMKQNPLSFHPRAKPAALARSPPVSRASTGRCTTSSSPTQARSRTPTWRSTPRSWASTWPLEGGHGRPEALGQSSTVTRPWPGKLGASGTPAFFINGRFLSGAQPLDNFKAIIDEELGKAEALVKRRHPGQPGVRRHPRQGRRGPAPSSPRSRPRPRPARGTARWTSRPTPRSCGPKNAKVTIVEWSDFQCPFCSRVMPTLKQIEETYGKDVRVVFRHQPLPFHHNAKLAAEAAMAAHEQGKFWEMHDKLFANQQALDRATLEKYAQELGLNMGKFKAALDSRQVPQRSVEADSRRRQRGGRQRHPDLLHQRPRVRGRAAVRELQEDHRRGDRQGRQLLAAGTKARRPLREAHRAEGAQAGSRRPPARGSRRAARCRTSRSATRR